MRHLLLFGLFVCILTTVTRADAQDRRRAGPQTRVTVVSTGGLRARDPRRAYIEERRDLEDITRIAKGWHRAAANGNRQAELAFDRRLDAWLDREILESIQTPGDHRYTMQIRALSQQLATLDRHPHRGKVSKHGSRRSQHGYYERKALIIDELVELSEQRARRAYAAIHRPIHLSFARR